MANCDRAGTRTVVFGTLLLGIATCLLGGQPAETLPGFKPNNLLESRGIDNVNLFSGDPGVVVPVGPEYPLGPGFSWQIKAYYSVKFWKFDRSCGVETAIRHAYVRGYPTLGVGWTLELGYVSTGPDRFDFDPPPAGIFVSPDGGRHPFYGTASPYQTEDGTNLRVTRVTSQHYEVEFPDGIRQIFSHPYERPRPTPSTSSYDFSDVDWDSRNLPSSRFGLTAIENSFDTTLLQVTYLSGSWRPSVITLNPGTPQQRSITYSWTTWSGQWDVLSSIQFPAFGTRSLTATFAFRSPLPFLRNVYDNSTEVGGGGNPCNIGNAVNLPMLDSITLSDPSPQPFQPLAYRFAYDFTDPWSVDTGALEQITLPTGGVIGYKYSPTAYTCFGSSCPADLEESGIWFPPLGFTEPEPERPDFSRYWDNSAGVSSRRETDPHTGLVSEVSYDRIQQVPLDASGQTENDRITRRTLVWTPTGNSGTQRAVKYLFNVEVQPVVNGSGIEKVRREYSGFDAGGTPVRSVVNCHEAGSGGPVCGYKDPSGGIQAYGLGQNARLQAQITWYGENPAGGGTCFSDPVPCSATTNASASYNSIARKYGSTTVMSTLPGVPFWGSRTTTTSWTPVVDATRWLLDLYSSRTVQDAETSPNQLPLPKALTTFYTFNAADGFLERVATSDSSSGTLTRDFTKDSLGNPQTERIYGQGGLSGDFTDTRTHQTGLVASTRRTGISWNSFDVTRDPDTGLVTQSRDPNGLATNYDYDALGRLTTISPPGGELPTKICYLAAITGNPAFTIVKKTNGDPCAKDEGTPATGSGAFEGYQYDGFGRPFREIRRLPNSLSSGSFFAKREIRYDDAGQRAFVSEWTPCPVSSYAGTNISNCAFPIPQPQSGLTGTTWSSFDPFGRARTVTRADGSTTTISYADGSVEFSDSLETVTVSNVSGSAATTVTRRDVLGRVISVEEPFISGMRGDTTYAYNVIDKLAKVTQPDGVNPAQIRTFGYDAFGFLRSEMHPEKGTTTYAYDALGNPLSKTEGGVASTFTYDLAGRLTRETAAGVSYVTNCYDGLSTCADGNPGFSGGTYKLGRLTRRYGFNPRSPRQPRVTEDFTYALAIGPGLSRRTTAFTNSPLAIPVVNETWTYNLLGLVATHGLPFAGATPNVTASFQHASGFPTRLVAGAQTLVNSSQYNPSGGLSSWTAGNGVSTTIVPDPWLLPRPRRIYTSVPAGSGGLDTNDFAYDGAGNIMAMGSSFFTYDARSRLKTGLGQSFDYDRWGNLNPLGVDPQTNRIKAGGYDSRGNMVRSATQTYRYDELSRQIALDGGKERYLYDGAGERIGRVTSTAPGLSLYTITPCRIRDTRDPLAMLAPFVPFTVQVTGGPCGIPPEAEALAGNLTALGSSQAGIILAQPAGTAGVDTSTINFAPGQTRANNFNLGLSTAGRIDLTASTPVHAIVDASGYYAYPGVATQETWSLTLRDEANRLSTDYTVTSSATTRKRNYFYFGNLLVATREEGSPVAWRYYASDHLGTPRLVTSSTGSFLENHTYRPFGEEIGGTFGLQPLKFAAMERDASSGNDYNHARFQSPTLGRFLSPDQIGGKTENPQTWNRYSYALGNPLKYIDPTGLDAEFAIENRIQMLNRGQITEEYFHAANRAMAAGAFGGLVVAAGGLALASRASAAIPGLTTSLFSNPNVLERGRRIEEALANRFGGGLPGNFPVIDRFLDGVATSVKSIDVGSRGYQNASVLTSRLTGFVDRLAGFSGADFGLEIRAKVLEVVISRGATAQQLQAIEQVRKYARQLDITLRMIVTR